MTRVIKLATAATGAAVIALAAFLLHPALGSAPPRSRQARHLGLCVPGRIRCRPASERHRPTGWDETLADRVRVALSLGFGDLASGSEIRASRGVVTLRGEVDELSDITRFETAVAQVGDVVDVDNLLRLRMTRGRRPRVLTA